MLTELHDGVPSVMPARKIPTSSSKSSSDLKVSTVVLHVTYVGLNVTNVHLFCSPVSDTATFFQV